MYVCAGNDCCLLKLCALCVYISDESGAGTHNKTQFEEHIELDVDNMGGGGAANTYLPGTFASGFEK